MPAVKTGDLVIHVPKDGRRGSGPYYVDNADQWGYGGDPKQVAVSVLVYGPCAHSFGLPRDEVEPVGHFEVPRSQRRGNAFTLEVLEEMRAVIERARSRFYARFPAFADGQTQVLLSEMTFTQRSGFIADGTATGIQADSWGAPGAVPNQLVYAVPREGARTLVEVTAHPGKFLLVPPGADRGHYVVVRRS